MIRPPDARHIGRAGHVQISASRSHRADKRGEAPRRPSCPDGAVTAIFTLVAPHTALEMPRGLAAIGNLLASATLQRRRRRSRCIAIPFTAPSHVEELIDPERAAPRAGDEGAEVGCEERSRPRTPRRPSGEHEVKIMVICDRGEPTPPAAQRTCSRGRSSVLPSRSCAYPVGRRS